MKSDTGIEMTRNVSRGREEGKGGRREGSTGIVYSVALTPCTPFSSSSLPPATLEPSLKYRSYATRSKVVHHYLH